MAVANFFLNVDFVLFGTEGLQGMLCYTAKIHPFLFLDGARLGGRTKERQESNFFTFCPKLTFGMPKSPNGLPNTNI